MRTYNRVEMRFDLDLELEDLRSSTWHSGEMPEPDKWCYWLAERKAWERVSSEELLELATHTQGCDHASIRPHDCTRRGAGWFCGDCNLPRERELSIRAEQRGVTIDGHLNRAFGTEYNTKRMRRRKFVTVALDFFEERGFSEKEVYDTVSQWEAGEYEWKELLPEFSKELGGVKIRPRVGFRVLSAALNAALNGVEKSVLEKQLAQRNEVRAAGILHKEMYAKRDGFKSVAPCRAEGYVEGAKLTALTTKQQYVQAGKQYNCCVGGKDPQQENVVTLQRDGEPSAILTAANGALLEVRGLDNKEPDPGDREVIVRWSQAVGILTN